MRSSLNFNCTLKPAGYLCCTSCSFELDKGTLNRTESEVSNGGTTGHQFSANLCNANTHPSCEFLAWYNRQIFLRLISEHETLDWQHQTTIRVLWNMGKYHINLYNVQLTWLIYHLVSPDTPMISADVIALQCPVIARLPVTPKHQRISLTPALPSRTVSSDTAIHQEKHDISTTTLFFRNWPTSEPLYNLLHYTQTKNVHHPTESPSPTTLIHTTKNDITSKGHSWHLTTRWPFCISSLEVPPQVGGWQWQHRSLWAKVVAAKLQDHWNKIDLLPPYLHLSPFLKLNASDSHLGPILPGQDHNNQVSEHSPEAVLKVVVTVMLVAVEMERPIKPGSLTVTTGYKNHPSPLVPPLQNKILQANKFDLEMTSQWVTTYCFFQMTHLNTIDYSRQRPYPTVFQPVSSRHCPPGPAISSNFCFKKMA